MKFNDLFKLADPQAPPPGTYDPQTVRKVRPADVSLKARHNPELKGNGVPGPGFYPLDPIINGSGFHVNSKYRSFKPKTIMRSYFQEKEKEQSRLG